MSEKRGLILAAGRGRRLGRLSESLPKPLLKIGKKSLIEYAINFAYGVGCKQLVVVGGYLFNELRNFLGTHYPEVTLIENPNIEFQNLTSFARGLEQIKKGGLFVSNADYIFPGSTLQSVAQATKEICIYVSFDKSGALEDVMRVRVDTDGNLVKMSKNIKKFDAIYTGMFYFPENSLALVKKVTRHLLSFCDKRKTTVEKLFDYFIKLNKLVKVVDVGRADWFEIDTEMDWLNAKKALD